MGLSRRIKNRVQFSKKYEIDIYIFSFRSDRKSTKEGVFVLGKMCVNLLQTEIELVNQSVENNVNFEHTDILNQVDVTNRIYHLIDLNITADHSVEMFGHTVELLLYVIG